MRLRENRKAVACGRNSSMKPRTKEEKALLKAAGICVTCAKEPSIEGKNLCLSCRKRNRDTYLRLNRKEEAVGYRKQRRKSKGKAPYGICPRCETNPSRDNGRAYCELCSVEIRQAQLKKQAVLQKRKNDELRDEVYRHYGDCCSCCGESEKLFLQIDHVNNDGNKQRKEIKVTTQLYRWIIDNNFPDTLQLLCANCNFGKFRNGGICPHQTKG